MAGKENENVVISDGARRKTGNRKIQKTKKIKEDIEEYGQKK